MPTKHPLKSRTLWVNGAMVLASLIVEASQYEPHHTGIVGIVFGAANIYLRLTTTHQLTGKNDEPTTTACNPD